MDQWLGLSALRIVFLLLFLHLARGAVGASLRRVVPIGTSVVSPPFPAGGSSRSLFGALSKSGQAQPPAAAAATLVGAKKENASGSGGVTSEQGRALAVPTSVLHHAAVGADEAGSTVGGEEKEQDFTTQGSQMGPQERKVVNKTHNVLKDRFGRFRLQEIMKEKISDAIWQRHVHVDWANESVARNHTLEEPEWTSHCKCAEYQWFYADHPSHAMCMNKGHAGYACGFYPASSQAHSCGFGLGCVDGSWCAQCTKDDECACGSCDKLRGECDRSCQDKECVTVTTFADEAARYTANGTETVVLFWDMKEELGSQGGAGAAGRATEAPTEGNFTTTRTASAMIQVIKRAIVTAGQCQPCGEKLEETRAKMVADASAKATNELTNKTQPEAKRKCEVEAQWRAEHEARSRAYRRAMKVNQDLVEEAKAKVRAELESKSMIKGGFKIPGADLFR